MPRADVAILISGTIDILENVTQVYDTVKDAEDLPSAFHEVGQRLPLVQRALRTAEEHMVRVNISKDSYREMKLPAEECKTKAKRLEDIFKKVASPGKASTYENYRKAVRQGGKGYLIEVLMKELMQEVCLLAENGAIKTAMEAQVKELLNAVAELETIAPSVPDEEPSTNFIHYGSGHQLILTGEGSQFNNTGSGTQYHAGVMNFGNKSI